MNPDAGTGGRGTREVAQGASGPAGLPHPTASRGLTLLGGAAARLCVDGACAMPGADAAEGWEGSEG
jgi:hypothetical protein